MPGCKPWGGPRKQGLVGTCLGDPSQGAAWQRGLLPCLPPPAKAGSSRCVPGCKGETEHGSQVWEEVGRAGPYIGVQCVSPPQVPWYALPSPDTVPPVSQSLQQRDRHPLALSMAGWLRRGGGVLTALPTSCGTPHIACSVPGEIQEGSSYGGRGMGARAMLCEGPLCTQGTAQGTEGSVTPPPAKLRGQGIWYVDASPMLVLPPAHRLSPLGSGTREQENSQHPQDCKRDLRRDATPMHPESAGGTAQLSGPTPDCNSFPKGNAFSSPVQTGTDTQAVLAAPASAAVPARRRGARPGGERFASCRLAVYGANTSMVWAAAAGDTGELRGHCPPAASAQEEPP